MVYFLGPIFEQLRVHCTFQSLYTKGWTEATTFNFFKFNYTSERAITPRIASCMVAYLVKGHVRLDVELKHENLIIVCPGAFPSTFMKVQLLGSISTWQKEKEM